MIIGKMVSHFHKMREMRLHKVRYTGHFKSLKHRRKLTREQKKEVQDYYISMIGKKVPLYGHEFFYSRTGFFTKEYFPPNVHHCDIVPKANMFSRVAAFSDKNMCDFLFPGENVAPSLLKNMNGYYYFEGNPVTEEEAVALCGDLDRVIIKPSGLSSGRGIQIFSSRDGVTDLSGKTVGELFKEYKKNFLVQKWIRQHKDLAALNSSSVNTIRILSYRSGMEVLIILSILRIGRSGSVIDNQCAGGIAVSISKDGRLEKEGYGGYEQDDIFKTDSGIVLEGYQVPSYDKTIEMVKRLHLRLPFFDMVAWDVAIQEDGEPVLIEFNTNPGLFEENIKSGYGEYTERIIKELWPRPNNRFPY